MPGLPPFPLVFLQLPGNADLYTKQSSLASSASLKDQASALPFCRMESWFPLSAVVFPDAIFPFHSEENLRCPPVLSVIVKGRGDWDQSVCLGQGWW